MEQMNKELIEERIDCLFLESKLEEIVVDVLNEDFVESFEDFVDELKSRIERDFEEKIVWLILQSYCRIENLNKMKIEEIEKEFFEDLKNCFNGDCKK
jgi:D-hexose-6-phosphate mutarotase